MRDVDVVNNYAGTFQWINAKKGRQIIKTEYVLDGSPNDLRKIKLILRDSLPIHQINKEEEDRLFSIFYNHQEVATKTKTQRADINNKIAVPTGYIISRAINGYCFGSPIKFVSKNAEKQKSVEELTEYLDSANNHKAIVASTYFSSICGIGYKLVLPRKVDEIDDTPFKISGSLLPQQCFVVKSNSIIPEDVLGVIISTYKDENNREIECYECYSKYFQYRLVADGNDEIGFKNIGFEFEGQNIDGFPLMSKQIPLIEVPRNPFRIGDWELITDLFHAKNLLLSNRQDDIQQVVDYLLVLTNCKFNSEEEKNQVLASRLIELTVTNVGAKANVDILKNPLDQNGVQLMQNYIDNLIEESAGIPNRAERSGSGQDTGRAVIFKSGFRDLENNAGLIIPEMEDSEKKSLKLCLGYCSNMMDNPLKGLKLRELAIKFSRTLTDDIVGSATAYSTLVNAGMDEVDALVASKIVDDPAEVGERAKKRAKEKLEEEQKRNQVTQIEKEINKGGVTNVD